MSEIKAADNLQIIYIDNLQVTIVLAQKYMVVVNLQDASDAAVSLELLYLLERLNVIFVELLKAP